MTVIAYALTPEGFVVGADSRLVFEDTRQVVTDCQRKLIHLRAPGVDMVCGWAGATVIGSKDGPGFDLTDETERIGERLSKDRLEDQYVKTLSEKLRESCTDQLARLRSWKDGTAALFVGYCTTGHRYTHNTGSGISVLSHGRRTIPTCVSIGFTVAVVSLKLVILTVYQLPPV